MKLEDWLEWTDPRGGTLEEHGLLEWFRNEQAKAWDEGADFQFVNSPFPSTLDKRNNPYRTGSTQ